MYRLLKRTDDARADLDTAVTTGEAWLKAHADYQGSAAFEFYSKATANAYSQRAAMNA